MLSRMACSFEWPIRTRQENPAQVIDARQALDDAGEEGAAAAAEAEQQVQRGEGPGGVVMTAVHAAMADDLNTPQVQ